MRRGFIPGAALLVGVAAGLIGDRLFLHSSEVERAVRARLQAERAANACEAEVRPRAVHEAVTLDPSRLPPLEHAGTLVDEARWPLSDEAARRTLGLPNRHEKPKPPHWP